MRMGERKRGEWFFDILVAIWTRQSRRPISRLFLRGAGTAVESWDRNAFGTSFSPGRADRDAAACKAQRLPEATARSGRPTISQRYAAGGQRTYKKVEGNPAVQYVRHGGAVLAVLEGRSLKHWTLTRPDGAVIGRVTGGGGRRYYVTDHLGSVRAVVDGGGTVREARNYYPFGLPMPGRYDKGFPPAQEDFTGQPQR